MATIAFNAESESLVQKLYTGLKFSHVEFWIGIIIMFTRENPENLCPFNTVISEIKMLMHNASNTGHRGRYMYLLMS
jgi:hypothetical protein